LICFALTHSTNAQVRPVNDYGALGLVQLLKRLNTTASVMMIGAHPDDEDSALLAYLARGESARTAYLSLTRGDGGQNIIGPEQGEALGIIRTEELLQARRLDGAEQYFTRAYDYGFSKTLDEAKSKWDEKVILCDVVRVIRTFRPLVVISRFSGTPADGHGQHQYAGYISPIAVKAASDPKQCTDVGLQPWNVLKFYVEQGFRDTSEPTLKINTGKYDPILGRSYFEIAMEGRSMHRSQGEGRIEFHGHQFSGLNYDGLRPSGAGVFRGIDTTVMGIGPLTANQEESFNRLLRDLSAKIREASYGTGILRPEEIIPKIADILRRANSAEWSTSQLDSRSYLREIQREAALALCVAAGIQIDALADTEVIVPGDKVFVSVKVFNGEQSTGVTLGVDSASGFIKMSVDGISFSAPQGWMVTKADSPTQNNAAFNGRENAGNSAFFNVNADSAARLVQPYWLISSRKGDLFEWHDTHGATLAFEPDQLVALVKVKIGETEVTLEQPVQYRFADQARGEIRREVNVVPALSVAIDRNLLIMAQSDKPQTRRLVVSVTNNSEKQQSGKISLNVQAKGLTINAPNGPDFDLKTRGAKASIPVEITIPANSVAGNIPIRVSARVGDAVFDKTMNVVAYPHIQTHRYYTPAETRVEVIDLKTAPEKIGYIMGSGDEVPEAIRQMGMDVTMLEEKDIASGDLSRFDSIVVGIRASETRPDMMANKQRLMEYVNNGGNVIMQYQRGNFAQSGLAPYPVDTTDKQGTAAGSTARVVDENAPVRILDAAHPIFSSPNKITDEDFKGWVQERNLYNLVTFDPKYTPLLESHDAGEQENKGGLVIAKVGKGNWVYCSYSFFRQLPAGVPGAYRLFANLLSMPKAGK